MQPGGWLVMGLSIVTVLVLVSFCLYKVLMLPPVDVAEHLKAPPDIDTGDRDNAD